MLKLNNTTENWREQITGYASESQLAEADVDGLADELRGDVLAALSRAGVDYADAHQQRRGAFVIVQDGTPEEREAFDNAVDAARKQILATLPRCES